jgi:chromatin assembly factor 1 subunit B
MREPVLSCDFSPVDSTRFATAGQDKSVKLWRLEPSSASSTTTAASSSASTTTTAAVAANASRVQFLASLERHSGPVNVVRFSPDGTRIASASDDGYVIVWHRPTDATVTTAVSASASAAVGAAADPLAPTAASSSALGADDSGAVESWSVLTLMRATLSIYDLAWSPSGDCIAVGCIDHKVIIWELASGHELLSTRDHEHYVQGVAWDPLSRFVASQSADRSLLLYDAQSALAAPHEPPTGSATKAQTSKKSTFPLVRKLHDWNGETFNAPNSSDDAINGSEPVLPHKKRALFLAEHDNISFFRRLGFTPDGSLLIVPAGVAPRATASKATAGTAAVPAAAPEGAVEPGDAAPHFCLQVFTTAAPRNPVLHLPFPNHPPVCVRACPALLALRSTAPGTPPPMLELPYRMMFAAAALDEIVIYDTQQQVPIAVLRGLHYSSIHDLTWAADGRTLLFVSADGYVSVATLTDAERGELLPAGALDASIAQRLAQAKVSAVEQRKRWRAERKAFLAAKRAAKQAAGEEVGADDEDDDDSEAKAKTAPSEPKAERANNEDNTTTTNTDNNASTSANPSAAEPSEALPPSDAATQPAKRRVVLMDA